VSQKQKKLDEIYASCSDKKCSKIFDSDASNDLKIANNIETTTANLNYKIRILQACMRRPKYVLLRIFFFIQVLHGDGQEKVKCIGVL
jgi:hypothetical protein